MGVRCIGERREERDRFVFAWAEIISSRRSAVVVNEDVKTRVNPIFDKGVELIVPFHFGEFCHYEILFLGRHVLASQVECTARRVRRQTSRAPHFERIRIGSIETDLIFHRTCQRSYAQRAVEFLPVSFCQIFEQRKCARVKHSEQTNFHLAAVVGIVEVVFFA